MNRALRFRKKLLAAGVIVFATLLLAFYFAYRSARQASEMNQWQEHTQEILSVLARARLERVRMQSQVWAFRATHLTDLQSRFATDKADLTENFNRLQLLTVDNPDQQKLLAELIPILKRQVADLQEAMNHAASDANFQPGKVLDWTLPTPRSERVREIFNTLESNEQSLLAVRSAAVKKSSAQAQWGLLLASALALAILLAAGYLIQREIVSRAKIEAGLRTAQEMLGVKFEEQRAELDHAVEDLHSQIRARQRAEEEIRRLNEDLEERVRLRTSELREANQELESFSYSVSHDLRAPLRHLDGFSRILREEFGSQLPGGAMHYLDRIGSAAKHMSALVEDLLHLSRIGRQSPQRQQCALSTIAEDAKTEVLAEAGDRSIQWKIGPLPEVNADPTLIRQVLVNLLSNAIKFSRPQSKPIIEIGSHAENGEIIIFVRDNGAGFDPRYADKLFGVFQRLHRQDEFEGTGIGLATVHRIVFKHGGRSWADSQPGQGATFYFSLPLRDGIRTKELQGAIGATA